MQKDKTDGQKCRKTRQKDTNVERHDRWTEKQKDITTERQKDE